MQSKVMHESVKEGKIVEEESGETLSDGTAGGLEEGAVNIFPFYLHKLLVTNVDLLK